MSGKHTVVVGNKGRIVIPADIRDRSGLNEGTELGVVETAGGVILLTRERLKDLVRADLAGLDLVSELLAERRVAAEQEP